jgi:hypothetical protein
VHAAGRRGHGKEFKTLAVELGLTGPMTATVASPELSDFINWTLLPQLGQYPHGAITGRGEILVPPNRAWRQTDHPAARRPAEEAVHANAQGRVPGVRLHDPAKQAVGRPGPASCPTDGAALALEWRR